MMVGSAGYESKSSDTRLDVRGPMRRRHGRGRFERRVGTGGVGSSAMAQTLEPWARSRVPPSSRRRRRKPFLLDFYSTAVGKKYVMAITGIIGIGFVVVHMIGNLKVYLGVVTEGRRARLRHRRLRRVPPRTAGADPAADLLAVGPAARADRRRGAPHPRGVHAHVLNRKARPVKYQSARDYQVANFASRTMRWTGIIVALFIVLAPRRPHLGLGQPRLRSVAPSTATSMRRCQPDPGGDPLHRRQHRARHPPVPRHVEPVPVDGLEQPTVQPLAPRHRRPASPRSIVVGNVSFPIAVAGVIELRPRRRHRHPRGGRRMSMNLDSKIPDGPLADKWENYIANQKLVNPANKRKFKIIVVGTGLAGASAAATFGELGYQVEAFTFHDSPRRAHSIAAQGGINAAKNYQGDGDSVHRLFYDTVKGGDFRAREANVHRLAEVSVNIIDQMVAQGVPFAREYGGLLDNRSLRRRPGQPHVLRPRPDRPAAPARRLPAARPPDRPRQRQAVEPHGDGRRRQHRRSLRRHRHPRPADRRVLVARRRTPSCSPPAATATCSTCRPTRWPATSPRAWRAHRRGAAFANPCYTQIHPTCIPQADDFQSKLTLMSESLRNDGRIWVPKNPDETRPAGADPRGRARLLPRADLPELRQPRASRRVVACGQARGRRRPRCRPAQERRVPRLRRCDRTARARTSSRSATATCSRCTSGSPARTPTRCRCASTRPATTRWAGSGSTTNCRPRSPACSAPARPTSPITAPTVSVPRR